MPFCRCGKLCQEDKCKKCGLDVTSRRNSIDPWQSRYIGSVVGLSSLTSPIESEGLKPACSPLSQRTISPIMKRFSSLLDSRKVTPSKTEVDEQIMNTCSVCNEKISGKTVRLPGSLNKYHWACLKCNGCHLPFEDTSFLTDSLKKVYHRSCFPQQCTRCSQSIPDKYISINSQTLHPNCFRCTRCQRVLHSGSIYTDMEGSFCQGCSNPDQDQNVKIVPQLQTITSHIKLNDACPKLQQTIIVKPSSLMSSRGRPLPRFGIVKECAGCKERIYSVHEEAPGPKASKWHKKCLVCQGCSKKLDSGATVYEDETTARLSPWCTTCLLSRRRKSFINCSAVKLEV